MNDCLLVFLAGVHGTGKGYFGDRLVRVSSWQYLSASALLNWIDYADDPKDKAVLSIPDTQARLLVGLEQACTPGGRYLLDGHLTLLSSEGEVTRIDRMIFERIRPKAILLKTERAGVVQGRLQQRDGKVYSLALIERMLDEEFDYALELAQHFNVPHFEINSTNEEQMLTVIGDLAERL